MEKVILLGNGINRCSNVYSWDDLINDLIVKYSYNKISKGDKPFPLLYEQIVNSAKKIGNENEGGILKYISEKTALMQSNDLHKSVVDNYKTILTTNYDYLIENQIADKKIKSSSNETRYSLFRSFKMNDHVIWHIHGEADKHKTICLGFDHYSGYLEKIRNYLITGETKSEKHQSVTQRLKNKNFDIISWVDHIIFSNIDILGFSFDYVEYELWWLLVYRNRLIHQKGIKIQNEIKYFYKVLEVNETNQNIQKEIDRNDLLRSIGIEVIEINEKDYNKFYEKILDYRSKKINRSIYAS